MVPVRMLGPLARYTGYAVGFRGLLAELLKRKQLDIELRAARNNVPEGTEAELLALLQRPPRHDHLGIVVGFPDLAAYLSTRYKIIYTMYEADDVPEEWQEELRRADEVWVPSQFCGQVMRRYNPRLRLVPWGVDPQVFNRKGARREPDGEYVFGAVGVQSPRKGTDVMIAAFDLAFGGRPGVKLVIKTRDTRQIPPFDNPQISVIDTDWPEDRLAQFYREIDCLVEPSRGEGMGMPPLQAALCGTPALVTAWGGPTDYIDDNGVWGVRIKGLVRANGITARGAHWAEPDTRHLAELMAWAVATKPQVAGDYSRWTLPCMADHFTDYTLNAWGRAHGRH